MKCRSCQFENPPGMKSCVECGAKLQMACPNCSAPNPPQFKCCGECGYNLSLALDNVARAGKSKPLHELRGVADNRKVTLLEGRCLS